MRITLLGIVFSVTICLMAAGIGYRVGFNNGERHNEIMSQLADENWGGGIPLYTRAVRHCLEGGGIIEMVDGKSICSH
jgi:hypothetical protein